MAGSVAKAYVQVIPSAEGIKGKLSDVFNSEMPSAGESAGGIFGSNLVGKIKGLIAAAGIGKILSVVRRRPPAELRWCRNAV